MKEDTIKRGRFAPKGKDSFYDAVVARVKAYFEANHISSYVNREMWVFLRPETFAVSYRIVEDEIPQTLLTRS